MTWVDLRHALLNVDALAKAGAALRQRNLRPASTPVWSAPAGIEVRQTRRQRHHRLSPDETVRLIAQYGAGMTVAELSRQFDVSETTVRARVGMRKLRHDDQRAESKNRDGLP